MKKTMTTMLSGTTALSTSPNADQLIDQWSGMIYKIAKKWATAKVPIEDLIQEGRIAVLKGIQAYKDDRGTALSTYMYTCISNAVKDCYQQSRYTLHASPYYQKIDLETVKNQEKRVVSTSRVLRGDNEGDEVTIGNMLVSASGCPIDNIGRAEAAQLLLEAIEELPEKDRMILNNYSEYFGDCSMEEIGANLGMTKQAVSLRLKSIRDKLHTKLKELK